MQAARFPFGLTSPGQQTRISLVLHTVTGGVRCKPRQQDFRICDLPDFRFRPQETTIRHAVLPGSSTSPTGPGRATAPSVSLRFRPPSEFILHTLRRGTLIDDSLYLRRRFDTSDGLPCAALSSAFDTPPGPPLASPPLSLSWQRSLVRRIDSLTPFCCRPARPWSRAQCMEFHLALPRRNCFPSLQLNLARVGKDGVVDT